MDTEFSPNPDQLIPFELLTIITGITRFISSNLDLDSLLEDSVELIRDKFNYFHIHLYLVDEAKNWAVLRVGTGVAGKLMLEQRYKIKIDSSSLIGKCIENGTVCVVVDGDQGTVEFRSPFLPASLSAIALPLKSGNEVIAVLEVQEYKKIEEDTEIFFANELTPLMIIADHLAIAIENARYVRELNKELEAKNKEVA